MSEILEALEQRYSRLSDEELLLIVHNPGEDYRPEAVELANQELGRRGDPQDRTEALASAFSRLEEEQAPLSDVLKIVCILFPGIPGLVISAWLASQGRPKAAFEALRWLDLGLGLWGLLVILRLFAV